ncbi:hypothetical protein [Lactobacillus equicursoris]|uniref:hypothetical protein n=1 Tax=Lactobacillus equicursoris TaxID=420645 RepID=UPI00242B23A0|nr:hypothetical protein [Lactobacillus equicursoris]MDD6386460.1 hypothetical protein [Lactobacillus equicursoris]
MKRLKGLAFALALPWSQNLLVAVLLIFLFTLKLALVILAVCWLCEQLLNTKWLLDKLQ